MIIQEKSNLASNVRFVYTIEEIRTGKIIYVGQTKYLGRRFAEHMGALHEHNFTNIYVYMREHNLEFYRDVQFNVVDRVFGIENATKKESELIEKYKDTVQNMIKVDTRKYKSDIRWRKIKCIETNKVWGNVKECFTEIGISRHILNKAIEGGNDINGKHYVFIE